jgi:hypothetical protein
LHLNGIKEATHRTFWKAIIVATVMITSNTYPTNNDPQYSKDTDILHGLEGLIECQQRLHFQTSRGKLL